MSRELKFRAFDNRYKVMLTEGFHLIGETTLFGGMEIMLSENSKANNDTSSSLERLNDVIIDQFTGLKDKNGKDIYEGDIMVYGRQEFEGEILNPGNFPLEVYFTEDASFEVRRLDKQFGTPDFRADMMRLFEIIGNIHVNPPQLI